MTKQQMINYIKEEEAFQWQRLKECQQIDDILERETSEITKRQLCVWSTIRELMQELEII